MDDRGDGAPRRFRLLFVCTGNICRSPFARFHTRLLLEMRLGPRWASWFDVASGGTGAVVGAEMHPLSRAQLGPLATHPDVAAFRARQLPARDVELADLVLTVSRSHRSAVLELEPRALRTTFTLPEFARLLGSMDPAEHAALPADPRERAHALVAAALAQRGQGAPVDPEDDAIPDPVQGGVEDHAEAARRIHAAVRPLVDAIGAAVPWPARPGAPRRPGPPYPARAPFPPGPRPPQGAVPPGAPPGVHPGAQPGAQPGAHPGARRPAGPPPGGVRPGGPVPAAGAAPSGTPAGSPTASPVPPGRGPAPAVAPAAARVPRPAEPVDPLSPATPLRALPGAESSGPSAPADEQPGGGPTQEPRDQESAEQGEPAVLGDRESRVSSRRAGAGEDDGSDEASARAHSTPRAGR